MAHREATVDWKHLVVPGVVLGVVLIVGTLAIWSFIERQSLVIQPEALPKITVVTRDPNSRLAASWVQLLSSAGMSPTLVPLETFDPIEGVVVFCEIPDIAPRLAEILDEFVRRGGALAFVGQPPRTPIGRFRLIADEGLSGNGIKFGENASPLLARNIPGYVMATKPVRVSFLKESPRMAVDVRWATNARAVAMHMEIDRGRYLWFGIDPDGLKGSDPNLVILLRSAFRWVSSQPVSDGGIGTPQIAKTLTPDARRNARTNRFVFSVDRSQSNPRMFKILMRNEGGIPLSNPTVKIWLPPRVTQVGLAGDIIMKRNATLTGVPEEGACLISLPSLTRNEERVMKLRIAEEKGPQRAPLQHAVK